MTISPDKQDISITITISEGQPYTVTGVKLQGEYLGKEDEFRELVRIKPGEPYRAQDATDTTKAFTDRFGLYGYAFARVEPRPKSIARRRRWPSRCAPTRSGACMCGGSTCRATRARATR